MRPELNDVKVLKLAAIREAAAEQLVLEVATRLVRDEAVRERLLELAPRKRRHEAQVAEALERVAGRMEPGDHAGLLQAALLDVVAVERDARDFYLAHADRVHDPRVARLFQDLAREEARNVRLAEEVLELASRRGALTAAAVPPSARLTGFPGAPGDAEE